MVYSAAIQSVEANETGEVNPRDAKVKPCPRCESDNIKILRTMPENATEPLWIYNVQCADCGIQIPPYRLKPTFLLYTNWRVAVNDWNTRPEKRRKNKRSQRTTKAGRRPTMRDVAALANVSTATVSHVINESNSVDAGTRTTVEKAIADLGYQPNEAARQLARGSRSDLRAGAVQSGDS